MASRPSAAYWKRIGGYWLRIAMVPMLVRGVLQVVRDRRKGLGTYRSRMREFGVNECLNIDHLNVK